MTKRKIELFIEIENEHDFENILKNNADKLICAELYSPYFGSCTVLDRLFNTIKLDWSDGKMILLKVLVDTIEALERFHEQSEPVYIFIVNKKVTKVFRGVDNIRFGELAKREIHIFNKEKEGLDFGRPFYELQQPTPDEMEWLNNRAIEKQQEVSSSIARHLDRQSARKRHRAEIMIPYLPQLNFVLFWPHCFRAHPELYERWDINNVIMVGREEMQLTKDKAEDILYAGDAALNEASLNVLLSGPALAICFQLLDTDRSFVALVRKILYEEIPSYDDTKPARDQAPQLTAFDYYKSYSLTKEEIWQKRREDKIKLKEEAKEKRARRRSEMIRLARQAKEEMIETKRAENEQHKLELLKAGNLSGLEKFRKEHDDDDYEDHVSIVPEEVPDEAEEECSEEEDENEYFPPPGLLIPGFYAPSNDLAKVNGLAILFPKLVLDHVTPQPEFLPPHVLVMLEIQKRYKAIEALTNHKLAIIHMGIFRATTPYDGVHIAYSVKQYDTISDLSYNVEEIKIVFMLSIKTDLPLLELMDLNPIHVSRDSNYGEDECAAMFSVNYGDDYPEFEDFP